MLLHTTPSLRALGAIALAAVSVVSLSACVSNSAESSEAIAVSSTNDACTLSAADAPAGTITFRVTNGGDDVTEFYVLADDGGAVISELENIGPGITRDLVVELAAGEYTAACKPGMVGTGIQAPFTVKD